MRLSVTLIALAFVPSPAHAADWPQWLGPNRDGSTPEQVRPWAAPPAVVWKAKVGEGHSSPVVVGDSVILHAATSPGADDPAEVRQGHEYVTAFDARTGAVKWVGRLPKKPFQSQFGNGPRSTPAVAGGKVYALGVTGTLGCFDLATGKLLADPVDVVEETKGRVPYFGVATSPLVDGAVVWVMTGGSDAGLSGRDAATLKPIAKSLADAASYSAPIMTTISGAKQLVALTADAVYGIPPAGGAPHWRFRFKDILSESSATPVRAGELLVVSSVTLGSVGLKPESVEGRPAVKEVWRNNALTCYFSTPVAVGGDIYLVTGRLIPPPVATLHCVDAATGKTRWTRPNVGKYGATIVRTGDNKLLMLEESGDLVLFEPNPEKFVELARAKVCGETWAHFAVAGGKLYVRDREALYCLDLARP